MKQIRFTFIPMRVSLIILIGIITTHSVSAQLMQSFVHKGEWGISAGLGHYFGDLNNTAAIDRPKIAGGAFFRKQFNPYISLRVFGNFTQLGYSDIYSTNTTQQRRNLSFNTNVFEAGVSGEFNFFLFNPQFEEHSFTPYVGLGVSVFNFDPYAFLNDTKYFLRPLGTEGQGSALYPDRKIYSPMALAFPITLGYKHAINARTNIFGEITYRFTNTDYLDDVSTTFAPDAFPPLPNGNPSIGFLLQDRSYETGTAIGIRGRQRGNSTQKDAFFTFQIGISFNLSAYRCPE